MSVEYVSPSFTRPSISQGLRSGGTAAEASTSSTRQVAQAEPLYMEYDPSLLDRQFQDNPSNPSHSAASAFPSHRAASPQNSSIPIPPALMDIALTRRPIDLAPLAFSKSLVTHTGSGAGIGSSSGGENDPYGERGEMGGKRRKLPHERAGWKEMEEVDGEPEPKRRVTAAKSSGAGGTGTSRGRGDRGRSANQDQVHNVGHVDHVSEIHQTGEALMSDIAERLVGASSSLRGGGEAGNENGSAAVDQLEEDQEAKTAPVSQ